MIETKNAKISGTMLGIEDHGIMTCFIYLDYGGAGQGFGGYGLDSYDEELEKRVGVAWGMEFIKSVLEAVGVEKWEALKGKNVRVKAEHGKVHAIGHIIKNKWFSPSPDLDYLMPDKN